MATSLAPRSEPSPNPKLVAVETPRRRAEQLVARIEAEGRWLRGPQRANRLARLAMAGEELRATIAWCQVSEQPEVRSLGLRLASSAWWAWFQLGRITEARAWLDAARQDDRTEPPSTVGSGVGQVWLEARIGAGWLALVQGDYAAADQHLTAAVAVARAARRWRSLGIGLGLQSQVSLSQQDLDAAVRLATEAVDVQRLAGDPWALALALAWLGDATRVAGDRVEATRLYAGSLESAQVAGDPWLLALTLANLGQHGTVAAVMPARPARLIEESLALGRQTGERWVLARGLEALASLVERGGERLRAARVRAGADALRHAIGTVLPPFDRSQARHTVRQTPPPPVLLRAGSRSDHRTGSTSWERPDGSVPLRVTTLGSIAIQVGERKVQSSEWGYTKPRDLFFLLLDGSNRTKEELGKALWPQADATQIRGNFHVALHRLRRVLGDPNWVIFAGDGYELNRAWTVRYDAAAFEEELAAANAVDGNAAVSHLRAAVALYTGDYLPGVRGAWAVSRRVALRQAYETAVLRLAQLDGNLGTRERHRNEEAGAR